MSKFFTGNAPDRCDICKKRIAKAFVDGRVKQGPWAYMCLTCHKKEGTGIGVGLGQLFTQLANGRWMQVE